MFSIDSFDEGWMFAAHGAAAAGRFAIEHVECTEENHEAAYGYKPERDDEANEQIIEAVLAPRPEGETPDPLGPGSEQPQHRRIELEDE